MKKHLICYNCSANCKKDVVSTTAHISAALKWDLTVYFSCIRSLQCDNFAFTFFLLTILVFYRTCMYINFCLINTISENIYCEF